MRSLLGSAATALTVRNKAPVPYASSRTGWPILSRNDPESQMRAMGSVGTLFAIVNRTSNGTAQVDWRLWRKAASGKPEDRVEVTKHAALDLWNKPNPFMPRQELVETTQQHIDLTGEGWWVVARNARSPIPLELWPVRPDRIAPVPSATEFIAGYVYTGPSGEKVPLDREDVIFLRMPNPLDLYRGMGPVQSILTDIDAARYSAEWNRNFFLNSAEPGGIIELEQNLTDDEWKEFQSRWREQHQGIAQAHRVAVLERGGKWIDRKFSMRDMQFSELRNVGRELMREAFGFPKSMLGTSDDVNRAVAEAQEVVFSRWLLTPRLERIKAALNNDVLPLFGRTAEGLEFDYEDPTPQDAERENAERNSKSTSASTLVTAGWDPDDVLETVGLPNMAFIGTRSANTVDPGQNDDPGPDDDSFEGLARRLAERNGHAHGHRDIRFTAQQQEQLEQVQADWEQALAALLAEWEPVSAAQRREILRQVREAVDDGDIEALAAMGVDTERGAEALAEAMAAMSALAAARIAAEAADQDVTVEPVPGDDDRLTSFAGAVAKLLGTALVLSAAREAIRVTGPDSTGDEVVLRVNQHLDSLSDAYLRDNLGGALSNAQNAGRIATLRAAPEAAYYSNETLDTNTCRNCRDVDGKWLGNRIEDVEQVYPNGGYTECLGRERCRGTVVAIWPEDRGS